MKEYEIPEELSKKLSEVVSLSHWIRKATIKLTIKKLLKLNKEYVKIHIDAWGDVHKIYPELKGKPLNYRIGENRVTLDS